MKNLPYAIQNPIAVFDSKTQVGSKIILSELSCGKKNFVVAIKVVDKFVSRRKSLRVNDIKSLYPRDTFQIIQWINQGDLLKWVDKRKAINWLGIRRCNSAEDAIPTDSLSAAKIIKEFENPTIKKKIYHLVQQKKQGRGL